MTNPMCTMDKHPKACRGPGYREHIDAINKSATMDELLTSLSMCCGENFSPIKSCPCLDVTQELYDRGIWVNGRFEI